MWSANRDSMNIHKPEPPVGVRDSMSDRRQTNEGGYSKMCDADFQHVFVCICNVKKMWEECSTTRLLDHQIWVYLYLIFSLRLVLNLLDGYQKRCWDVPVSANGTGWRRLWTRGSPWDLQIVKPVRAPKNMKKHQGVNPKKIFNKHRSNNQNPKKAPGRPKARAPRPWVPRKSWKWVKAAAMKPDAASWCLGRSFNNQLVIQQENVVDVDTYGCLWSNHSLRHHNTPIIYKRYYIILYNHNIPFYGIQANASRSMRPWVS